MSKVKKVWRKINVYSDWFCISSELLLSMMNLIMDENTLELGLDNAYTSFNHTASIFLKNQGLTSSGSASEIVVKLVPSAMCGFLGSLSTFPGLRVKKMHWDTLRYHKDNKLPIFLANFSYVTPLMLACLWIKPIFTTEVFRGILGLATWWSFFILFASTALGMLYQIYFTNAYH